MVRSLKGVLLWRRFAPRHNSAGQADVDAMVKKCGFDSIGALIDATVPKSIRRKPMDLGKYSKGYTESGILKKLRYFLCPLALIVCCTDQD